VTIIARIHRYAGYAMLFFGNLITSGGIATYVFGITGKGIAFFGFFVIITWLIAVSMFERKFRNRTSETYHFDKLTKNWQ